MPKLPVFRRLLAYVRPYSSYLLISFGSLVVYALLSSAMSIVGRLLAMGSGFIAEEVGWPGFFVLTIVAAAPALVLLFFIPELEKEEPEPDPEP
jgi:PAT family beta-lactamase induction signal transducer AmpG